MIPCGIGDAEIGHLLRVRSGQACVGRGFFSLYLDRNAVHVTRFLSITRIKVLWLSLYTYLDVLLCVEKVD